MTKTNNSSRPVSFISLDQIGPMRDSILQDWMEDGCLTNPEDLEEIGHVLGARVREMLGMKFIHPVAPTSISECIVNTFMVETNEVEQSALNSCENSKEVYNMHQFNLEADSKFERILGLACLGALQIVEFGVDAHCPPLLDAEGNQYLSEMKNGNFISAEEKFLSQAKVDAEEAFKKEVLTFRKGRGKALFLDALENLVRFESSPNYSSSYHRVLRALVVDQVKSWNKARAYKDLGPVSNSYLQILTTMVKEQVAKEAVLEVTTDYQTDDLVDALPDSFEQVWETKTSEDAWTALMESKLSGSKVDVDWSHKVLSAVFRMMDPEGKGVATKALKFSGFFWRAKDNKSFPLKHLSTKQSLMWLSGSKAQGKKGMIADPRFTSRDREALATFLRASWDNVKGVETIWE